MSKEVNTGGDVPQEISALTDELARARREIEDYKLINEKLIDVMLDPADIVNETYDIVFQNSASVRTFGRAGSKKCYEFYRRSDSPCPWCTAVKSIREKKSFHREVTLDDGTFLEIHSIPLPMPGGGTVSLEVARDVTKSKKSEFEIRDQTRKLEVLNQIILSANRAEDLPSLLEEILISTIKLMGLDSGGVYLVNESSDFAEIVASSGLSEEMLADLKKVRISEAPFDIVFLKKETLVFNNHEAFSSHMTSRPEIRSLAGIPLLSKDRVIGALNVGSNREGFFTDQVRDILSSIGREIGTVVARMRAEAALKEREEKWRSLFENSIESVFTVDLYGNITAANAALAQMSGYLREELIGSNFAKYCAPETADDIYRNYNTLFKSGVPINSFCYTMLRKDGRERMVEGYVTMLRHRDRIVGFQGTLRDITERLRAEEALAEEKERLAVTLRSIGDGVITTDIEGNVVLINRAAELLTGFGQSEAAGLPIETVFHIINEQTRKPCDNPAQKIIDSAGMIELDTDTVLIARDGTERIIADSGSPIKDRSSNIIGVVLVFRDVTEKKKIDDELRKTQKLESLGTLAGGIAHDYNNILTAILANISLAKMYAQKGDKVSDRLDKMENAAIMASRLTQQLLTFSRGGAPVKELISIGELIKDSTSFALGGTNVRCEFQIEQDLWPVSADVGQISQVINNIVINAHQAMPSGGSVRVGARNVTITDQDPFPIPVGRYLLLSIADEGVGISPKNLDKIFDPFFTTKQKGSGLGLSISYSIVKNHDGHIVVQSKEGHGTTFHIYLPASDGRQAEKAADLKKPLTGRGKILVMDDEAGVRDVVSMMLGTLGYETETAQEGQVAVELFEKAARARRPFDLVIMDLTIKGGMGGLETLERLQRIDPSVRAVVSSGYSNDPIMADFRRHGFVGVLAKPYKITTLSELLDRILERGQTDS